MSNKGYRAETADLLKFELPGDASQAEKEANQLMADDVVEAIKNGKSIEISNAIISGPFYLNAIIQIYPCRVSENALSGPIRGRAIG